FGVAAIVGIVVRLWLVTGAAPSWWQDSFDYERVGSSGVLSRDLWVGARPPMVPLLLGLTGGSPGRRFVIVQAAFAGLSWAWLATEVGRAVHHRWLVIGSSAGASWPARSPSGGSPW